MTDLYMRSLHTAGTHVRAKDGSTGHVVSSGYGECLVNVEAKGQLVSYKLTELTIIPAPTNLGLSREEIHAIHSDLSHGGPPHPDVVQAAIDAEVRRKRDAPVPDEIGTRVRLRPGTGHMFSEGVITEAEENRVRVQHGLLDAWINRTDLLQV